MKDLTITKATTKRQMDDFVKMAEELYRYCPCYVPDLRTDVRNTFCPAKNPGLEFADVQPFIAYDAQGKPVGRIAAIINHRANEKWNTRNVRFGYFDFVDDTDVSAALLDTVANGDTNAAWTPSKDRWASPTSTRKGCSSPTSTAWAR